MPRRYSDHPVDAQVYQAERVLRLRMQDDPEWVGYEPWFVDLEHAQVYVDLALSRVSQRYPQAGPVVVRPSRYPAAHYLGAIYLPEQDRRWMRGLIALHELAHHLTRGVPAATGFHDARFIDAFGELLAEMYDPALRGLFAADLAARR